MFAVRFKKKITKELIELASKADLQEDSKDLYELFCNRYGETAGEILSQLFERIYFIHPQELEPFTISHSSMGRLKHLDDNEMLVLKAHPYLDTVLAARRRNYNFDDDTVSLYPKTDRGMRGFCEKADTWLRQKGVNIKLNTQITEIKKFCDEYQVVTDSEVLCFDQIIWANDNIEVFSKLIDFDANPQGGSHHASMFLLTLFTDYKHIKDFTYLQNFTLDERIYRVASAGRYSHQVRDGISFITCECPVNVTSKLWNSNETFIENAWNECKKYGVVDQDSKLLHHDLLRVPKTNKLFKTGTKKIFNKLKEHVDEHLPGIYLDDIETFNRRQIYLSSTKIDNLC